MVHFRMIYKWLLRQVGLLFSSYAYPVNVLSLRTHQRPTHYTNKCLFDYLRNFSAS